MSVSQSLPESIAHLRAIAAPLLGYRAIPFGLSAVDGRLAGGGLRAGALHEVAARSCSLVDDAAATLFLAGIAAREARHLGAPVLWVSCRNDLYAPGLAQAGLLAADVIHAQPRDEDALLAVVEDAVRDGTPSAVVAEAGKVSMVASRRLQLVAADADLPVLLLRRHRRREQDPLAEPSAAWTRWRIASAPSARLDVSGVGRARWAVEMARQRGGESFSLIVEGSDETGRLAVPAALGHRTAEAVGTARSAAA
ncbi:protein ImuA [Sphingobium sp. B2D3A]|uniref:ImuA family protein n=1 Tax=unclassified Sphingobium TaxID=2611147 RepID=UPI0022241DF0|nr:MULTISPECIES: protein ImuA [unclassified Sphingobium]MCW2338292.1 protein ImuA [Sphingobium sp. B2D3A]MCW2384750.1 protein ImuA [Sphingobium sp. B2D3D]